MDVKTREDDEESESGMKLKAVSLPSEEVNIAALHYIPESDIQPTALVYAHGFTSGKYSLDLLASYLASKGYEGLTFDFVGHKLGATGGEMRHTGQAVANLKDAIAWLRQQTQAAHVVLVGHSMGAAAALAVAAEECNLTSGHPFPRLAGIVSLCMGEEPSRGFTGVIGRAMLTQRRDYVAGAPALELLQQLDSLVLAADEIDLLPALFIAARQDVLLPVERVEALAARVGASASVAIMEASHLEAPDRARAVLIQWLEAQGLSSKAQP